MDFQRQLPGAQNSAQDQWLHKLHLDPMLLALVALVLGFGLVVLFSAAGDESRLFDAQFQRVLASMVVLIIAAQLPPGIYLRWAPFIYVLGLVLLLLVLLVGVRVKGSQRWLEIPGVLRFQPSELMKIAVPMALAWYLQQRVLPPSARHVVFSLMIISLPALAIAAQPDLGTAVMLAASGLGVVFLAGVSMRYFIGGIIAAIAAVPVAWNYLLDYQRERVLVFLDPERDPLGAGYHIIQSKIGIGSGGLFGKGLAQGTQSQLKFLPERHTDFIFAIYAEELGFFGSLLLILLFALLIFLMFNIASQMRHRFSQLTIAGFGFALSIYVIVNLAMVMGLAPVVGVPLPFISYGGTSLMTFMAGIGVILAMERQPMADLPK